MKWWSRCHSHQRIWTRMATRQRYQSAWEDETKRKKNELKWIDGSLPIIGQASHSYDSTDHKVRHIHKNIHRTDDRKGLFRGRPRGVVANMLVCGLEISELELQLRYCVHFRTNTLGKSINSLVSSVMG